MHHKQAASLSSRRDHFDSGARGNMLGVLAGFTPRRGWVALQIRLADAFCFRRPLQPLQPRVPASHRPKSAPSPPRIDSAMGNQGLKKRWPHLAQDLRNTSETSEDRDGYKRVGQASLEVEYPTQPLQLHLIHSCHPISALSFTYSVIYSDLSFIMSVIAVAGGTGNLGHAVVDALNATGKFTVFILGRQVSQWFSVLQVAPNRSFSSPPLRRSRNLAPRSWPSTTMMCPASPNFSRRTTSTPSSPPSPRSRRWLLSLPSLPLPTNRRLRSGSSPASGASRTLRSEWSSRYGRKFGHLITYPQNRSGVSSRQQQDRYHQGP